MRTTVVGLVRNLSSQFSSIIQIGDSVAVSPRSEVLAVQRQIPEYWGAEGNFNQFLSFRSNVPEPLLEDDVSIRVRNDDPLIQVGWINVDAISVSGVLHVGSTKVIDTDNRTVHVRQLLEGKRPTR